MNSFLTSSAQTVVDSVKGSKTSLGSFNISRLWHLIVNVFFFLEKFCNRVGKRAYEDSPTVWYVVLF